MDFDLSEYQKMLRDSAREFFAKEMPITEVRKVLESQNGYSNKLWKQMADMGWLGIMIPERYGGTGGESVKDARKNFNLILLCPFGCRCIYSRASPVYLPLYFLFGDG